MASDREIKSLIFSLPWRRIRFAGLVVVAVCGAAMCIAAFAERNEGWLPWQFLLLAPFGLLLGYGFLAYVIVPFVVDLIRGIPPAKSGRLG